MALPSILAGFWVSPVGAIAQLPNRSIAQTPSSQASVPAPELEAASEEPVYLRPSIPCPADVETLMAALLRDLPSYANRVASRSLRLNNTNARFGTILAAGRAEFEPLDLSSMPFSQIPDAAVGEIQQVFFTTLERQYTESAAVELEQYHWLFLAEVADGWRLALIFSRIAVDGQAIRPPTPPRETSDGIIGRAVQLWLRDCRAGAVYPAEL